MLTSRPHAQVDQEQVRQHCLQVVPYAVTNMLTDLFGPANYSQVTYVHTYIPVMK